MQDPSLLHALAQSLLNGESAVELIVDRCSRTLGRRWRWIRPLALRYAKHFGSQTRPRHREVVKFLENDRGLRRAHTKYPEQFSLDEWWEEPHRMQPIEAAKSWDVPAIESVGDLAKWLGLSPNELRWFADLKALEYKGNNSRLRNYSYRILAKRFGRMRLIEAPKARLKDRQQQILAWILAKIPAHPAAHGFVKKRSIRTSVAPHVGRRVVLRMDLRDFFPTFSGARIQTVFRMLGYPESVADLLGGICANATPRNVWEDVSADGDPIYLSEIRRLYARPHLPQGAPTSPALANLCAYRADCRLNGLARAAGATYTRYADDLAFSGGADFDRCVARFAIHAAAILLEEGFEVNHRKTRVMRRGVRQHLAGVVTNEHVNVVRADFDRLKATLTNCVRHGPASQNREGHANFRAHMAGRISFVEMLNPQKGARLKKIFEQISWPDVE